MSGGRIRYAVFDADGTLLDSMGIWQDLGERYLRKKGCEPETGLWQRIQAMTLPEACAWFQQNYDIRETVETMMEEISGMLTDFYYNEVQEKPGALACIRRLHSQGTRIFVATASERDPIEHALQRLGIYPYVERMFTCTELGCGKDSPLFWERTARELHTVPRELTVFEDALHAARTATMAGCMVYVVYDRYSEADARELRRLPGKYITDFEELEALRTVLSIAGSDCSGGAGIQADLKTMCAHGVYGMTAITALTVQNTRGVGQVLDTPADVLEGQLEAVFSDIFPDAVKIGMLPSEKAVAVTARMLQKYRPRHIVIDPVMCSTSGKELMNADARERMVKELLGLAEVITPNIPEAELLSGRRICTPGDVAGAAAHMYEKIVSQREGSAEAVGPAILIKGGHAPGAPVDHLWIQGEVLEFPGERIDNPNTHGTGCILSTAIACNLAAGKSLPDSVREAKRFLSDHLKQGLNLGGGNGPVL